MTWAWKSIARARARCDCPVIEVLGLGLPHDTIVSYHGPARVNKTVRVRGVRGGFVHKLICALAGALALLTTVPQAAAQEWPARPIKFIVSQAAGGTPDIICRLITEKLARALGQQVVVENRPGGGNVIGAQAAARSAPDGYTFFFATAAALVTNPYTFKSLPYDPARDFAPVSMVAGNPFFLLAHPG